MIPAKVIRQKKLAAGYFLLELEAPEVAEKALPGQFVRLSAWPGNDPLLPRPFSVHEVEGARISVLYQVRGRGTRILSALRRGDEVKVDGPLGRPFPVPDAGPVWVIAGGIGVAPFLFYLETLKARGVPRRLFYGARSRGDLLRISRLSRLSPLIVTTEDGSAGRRGLVTEALSEALTRERPAMILACGPPAMLSAVGRIAGEAGIPTWLSLEAVMACGRGLCLGCAVPRRDGGYLKVCVEGPAVGLREVDLDALT